MTEEEYEKKVKGTKTFCIIIGILFLIGLFKSISQENIIASVMALVFIILLYLFYSFTKKKKVAGPIIGIVLGSMYILQLNILTIIVGIFVLVDSVSMLKYINKLNKQYI